jgi:myo-inositol 2-dehydrogenase / D-chiro-inositol 1-dehydrogenase
LQRAAHRKIHGPRIFLAERTDKSETVTPMVISGTHPLNIVVWYMEAKKPAESIAWSDDR